jgi:circadian clock protein KaiC
MKSDVSMYGIEEYFVSGVIKLEMEDPPAGIRKASIVKMRGGSYSPYPFYFKITTKGLVSSQSEKDLKGPSIFKRIEA